jgi:pseudouridine 5'-phosphatase
MLPQMAGRREIRVTDPLYGANAKKPAVAYPIIRKANPKNVPPTHPCTHVLFDLDGVLLDTERLYTEATQAIVGRFGKTFTWEIKREAMGRDAHVSARIVLERLGVPLTSSEFLAERGPILERLVTQCRAMEGAEAFVRSLVARGIPVAVATSSDRPLYELKVRPHPWFDLFGAVVCGDDPRVSAKKPAPDIFLVAARDLGAEPARCLVFEDSLAGVEAALAAGMRVVALPDPAAGPDHGQHYRAAHHVLRGWSEASLSLLGG